MTTSVSRVIGYTTAELIDVMLAAGIHCSVDKFRALVIEMQQRAVRMVVCAEGPAVEIRVIGESRT